MTAQVAATREQLAAAGRRLAEQGLVVGTAGNLSARAGELVAVTPTGAALERLTAAQVVVVDLDGEPVEGEFAPTSELQLHLGIYRRHGAGAVVHTHSPLATALACVLDELPVIHYQLLELGGPVRVAPYATFGTRELADAVVEALHERSAALLSNHGAVVHGPDVETAVERALLLEWGCQVYWYAAAVGSPRTLDAEQQAAFTTALAERGYGTLQPLGGPTGAPAG
jgi:L-fuculose-phosphate aldolase